MVDVRPMYRQGDVLLEEVARLAPRSAVRRVPAEGSQLVLAHGELTGHLHAVPADAGELLETTTPRGPAQRYLRILVATRLSHQEHAPIDLAPGLYRVAIQDEYTPDPGSWRHVRQAQRRTVAD